MLFQPIQPNKKNAYVCLCASIAIQWSFFSWQWERLWRDLLFWVLARIWGNNHRKWTKWIFLFFNMGENGFNNTITSKSTSPIILKMLIQGDIDLAAHVPVCVLKQPIEPICYTKWLPVKRDTGCNDILVFGISYSMLQC